MEFLEAKDMWDLVRVRPSAAKLKKITKYETDFDFGFDDVGGSNYARRVELLNELLENVPNGVTDSAPLLSDIRVRDGYLRSIHSLITEGEELELVGQHLKGLLKLATASTGEIRGQILTVWAGLHWCLGNTDAFKAIKGLEEVSDISLWLLLDIAQRHDVPSSVWGASLEAVSLEACLMGAA